MQRVIADELSQLGRRGLAAFVALLVGFVGLIAAPFAANAAEHDPVLSNMRVTLGIDPEGNGTEVGPDSVISADTALTFHADWTIPGATSDGDTFEVPLPETFRLRSSEPFALKNSAGTTLANCQYLDPATALTCTIVGGPHQDITGKIWFSGYLDHKEDGTDVTWTVGNSTITIPNPSVSGTGPYRPNFKPMKAAQSGIIEDSSARLVWGIYMWPGGERPSDGTQISTFNIVDQLTTTDATMPHKIDPTSFNLLRYDRVQIEGEDAWQNSPDLNVSTGDPATRKIIGEYRDGVWTTKDLDGEVFGAPVVAADGQSFTFQLSGAKIPHAYRLEYVTVSDGVAIEGDKFTNTVTLNNQEFSATNTAHVLGGGGADAGAYTSFSVKKEIEASVLPDGMPAEYVLQATQGEQSSTVRVPADGNAVNSPYFPASGGPITLCEELPDVAGVTWGDYTITGDGVTGPDNNGCFTLAPVGGQRISIVLKNSLTPTPVTGSVTVGDYTWVDANRDGIQDQDEDPLAGVELTLTGPDGTEVTDVNGNVVGPQTTDENGKYLFENLPVLKEGESYTVTVTKVPEGYYPTKVEAGDDRASDSSGDKAVSHLPLTKDGDEDLTLDFGYVTYEPSIEIVKKDSAGNDANDAESAVDLTGADGATKLNFTITNNGDEALTDITVTDEVTAGDATVENLSCAFPDDSTGTEWAGPFEVGASFDCTADLSGVKAEVPHTDKATVTGKGKITTKSVKDEDPYNAKVKGSVTVGDYTWVDANRDGIQDEDEEPLAGVVITITGPDGKPVTDVLGNPVGPQTTDENGKYLFEDLPILKDGESYTVTVTKVPDGYFQTVVEAGDDRAVDSSGDKAVSHLPLTEHGAKDLTLDFGFVTYEPSIEIVKKDAAGNDANDAESSVDLTEAEGSTGLVFTITNDGNETLTDIKVSDEVTAGDATVENLSCVFPDDSTGTEWSGPFEVGASFDCTADLSGVKAEVPHTNNASVEGVSRFTGTTVTDEDPYNAKVIETPPTDEPSTPPTDEPSTPPSVEPSTPPADDPSSTPPAAGSDEPVQTPPASQPAGQPGQKPGLAQTGMTTGWLAVAGAALVLGGATLLMVRRRNTVTE